jgi:hypothetical protein
VGAIAEEEGGKSWGFDQLFDQPTAPSQPLAHPPGENRKGTGLRNFSNQRFGRLSTLKLLTSAERKHLQLFARDKLMTSNDH